MTAVVGESRLNRFPSDNQANERAGDPADSGVEHFVTLFDAAYLPLGLALYESLVDHAQPFVLSVLAVDAATESALARLNLPGVNVIPLQNIESDSLSNVRATRGRAAGCWMLTPLAIRAAQERHTTAERVTYLDADICFFDDPRTLLVELNDASNVLITEHAYGPEYDQTAASGRFCVQFVTFDHSTLAERVLTRWQEQCLAACPDEPRGGLFGDQKYLDEWPSRYGDLVRISTKTDRTLAPWNVRCTADGNAGRLSPVFFHFHGLRLLGGERVRLHSGYCVGTSARPLYDEYLARIARTTAMLRSHDIVTPPMPLPVERFQTLRRFKRRLYGTESYGRLPRPTFPFRLPTEVAR